MTAGGNAKEGALDPPPTQLRRGIGWKLLLLFIAGDMVGGGIYALVGQVGAETGGAIWSAFLIALLLALMTAFAYAELATKYPQAGGAAYYVHRAFGLPFLSFLMALAVATSGITSASSLALAFGGKYLAPFVNAPAVPVALLFIAAVAWINYRGITESLRINAIFTLIELAGLLLIVGIGVAALAGGTGDISRPFQFKEGTSVPLAMLAGTGLAFYALVGFEDSVNLAEETKDPSRSYPRALFGGILLAGLIYLLVTVTASIVVPTADLTASDGPLLEVVKRGPGEVSPQLFSIIALFAFSNGALLNMIMASRLLYGMSRQDVLPASLARVHPRRRTPVVSILLTTAIAMGLIATGDVGGLARTTVLLLLLAFAAVNVSMLVLRREKVAHPHFKSPVVFPLLGLVVCAALLTQQPREAWLRAGGLLVAGVLLYGVNLFVKHRLARRAP